jgi:hypothetical protein
VVGKIEGLAVKYLLTRYSSFVQRVILRLCSMIGFGSRGGEFQLPLATFVPPKLLCSPHRTRLTKNTNKLMLARADAVLKVWLVLRLYHPISI